MTATDLRGVDLDREIERVCFNDDGSCFAPHGIERRDRIGRAMWMTRFGEQPSYACHNMTGRSMTFEWGGDEFSFETPDDYRSLPFKSLRVLALKYWDHREGKPYQAALEAHVSAYRADPRPWSRDVRLAMRLLPEHYDLRGNHWGVLVRVWNDDSPVVFSGDCGYANFPDATDDERREWATATAICRAVLAARK